MTRLPRTDPGRPDAPHPPESRTDPRGLFHHLERMRRRLRETPAGVDYNHLSPAEKQAVLALVETDEARFRGVAGRTHVVGKGRNWVAQFLSMGSHS